jgi:class 3 adenylate cyclase
MKRRIAAIMAADIAGFARLVAEDEEETLRQLESHRTVFDDDVTRHGGRVFNTAGDAVLAEFRSAVEAVRCAIAVQEKIRSLNLGYPIHRQMHFRIGITVGDVVERRGDLLGGGVNIAARLEAIADPGGVCISSSVYEQVSNKLSARFADIGLQEIKNIPSPVHAYALAVSDEADRPMRSGATRSVRDAPEPTAAGEGVAPIYMGAYSRPAVDRYIGSYLTLRPAFTAPDRLVAYRTDITWDAGWPSLRFQEHDRPDAVYANRGRIYVSTSSQHIYLVSTARGAVRMIVVSQLDEMGVMRGLVATLNKQRAFFTPVAAPIVYARKEDFSNIAMGHIEPANAAFAGYKKLLDETVQQGYARVVIP